MSFKMYFSGSFRDEVARHMIARDASRLVTFAYPREIYAYCDLAAELGARADVMVDSGAFTAWNKGRPVELQDLIAAYKDVEKQYGGVHDFTFISLDVIPGERGRMPTREELELGMQRSYDNWHALRSEVASPVLPVYHSSEPLWFRDLYLEHTDWICLSMLQDLTEKQRVNWAMEAQVPGIRMHGLAATGSAMMERVDWYSVDSAGWLMGAAMGKITWMVNGRMKPVDISRESPARRRKGAHVDNMTFVEEMEAEIAARGWDVNELRENYMARCKWNVDMWLNYTPPRRITKTVGLFDL